MSDTYTGYIIDAYNKYAINDNVVSIFNLYGKPFCIRQINKFDWGQPIFPEKDIEDDYSIFCIYDTQEDAEQYVRNLKYLEGVNVK